MVKECEEKGGGLGEEGGGEGLGEEGGEKELEGRFKRGDLTFFGGVLRVSFEGRVPELEGGGLRRVCVVFFMEII